MAKQYDLCRFYTATTGTGTITAGAAVPGFLAPADAGVADGDVVSYGIVSGNNREVGVGTWNASAGTLTRTTIRKSTNGGAAINLTGTSQVFATLSASDLAGVSPQITKGSGSTTLGSGGSSGISWSSVTDDTGAAWSSTVNSDRITVPAGKNRARVTVRGSGSAGAYSLTINKNGSGVLSGSGLLLSDWFAVTPGDYIQVAAANAYNGSNTISASIQVEWDGIGVSMGVGSSASTTTALYRISTFFTYPPLASEVLLMHAVTDAFGLPAGTAGIAVKVGTNPAAATTIDVQKNGTSIGGISISTAGVVSSTIAATTFAVGDLVTLKGPATPDAALANVAISLRGY